MEHKNIRQRIWSILLMSGFLIALGFFFMLFFLSQSGGTRELFGMPSLFTTMMLSTVVLHVGMVLMKQQTRLEQMEEELARLKSAGSPPQSPQP